MIPALLSVLLFSAPADRPAPPPPPAPPSAAASAKAKDWKEEFEQICGKTDEAMQLSDEDLSALIKRCDDLKPLVDERPESERKVYGKRLESCRRLFVYVLESRQKG